jgi:putative methyltransferase (TIGR04325 family)
MNIFEGVFKGTNLKKINQQNLNNDIWKKIVIRKIKKNKNYNQTISSSVLPIILATEFLKKKIKILDFGSGGLDLYFELNNLLENYRNLNKKKSIKCKIYLDLIEVPKILDVYKKTKFSKYFKCNFLDHYKKKKYDIVYISNTLHYIDEPKKLIKLISNSGSKYIIINSTRIGENKTFISLQNFYKYKIPTWFFNMDNFIKQFRNNYEAVFTSDYLDKYLDQMREIPMNNFPLKFRLKHTKTIIFKKK